MHVDPLYEKCHDFAQEVTSFEFYWAGDGGLLPLSLIIYSPFSVSQIYTIVLDKIETVIAADP